MATFAVSLVALAISFPKTRPHPAAPWAIASVILLCLGFFHPQRDTFIAGLAQVGIYISIFGPLWWVAGMRVDARVFRAVLITLWLFYTASAGVGVLQTLFPGHLQPTLSSVIQEKGDALVEGYKVMLANGEQVFRPMGLTDVPGGAAVGGLYAFVLGLGLLLSERSWWWKGACFCAMFAGLYCILLSQIRSILIMTGICSVVFLFVLAWRRDWTRFSSAAVVLVGATLISAVAALAIGGDSVVNRLATLVEDDPATVYYVGRGHFIDYMIHEQLEQFPLGAGLGRWGMTNYYFGDPNASNELLWAEIQWQSWLYDGGIPLIISYCGAIAMALLVAWKIAMRGQAQGIGLWAAILFAYNVGALAITFNYPIFVSQSGMEFWLLNACLFAAWQHETRLAPGVII